jgi:hypothetical protein
MIRTPPFHERTSALNDAERFLAGVLARDVRRCRPGHALYTLWCDDRGLVGLSEGNIFAGEFLAPQMFFFRPAPGWAQYRTPIEGYYQCGSGTHPGGCVMGAPGKLAAGQILRDRERAGRSGRSSGR